MGLDTNFDCWHGPYSSFNTWRRAVAKAIGIDVDAHWGELNRNEPVKAKVLGSGAAVPPEFVSRPLMRLLDHSDCDGILKWEDCAAIADDLSNIIGHLENNGPFSDRKLAVRWIDGLRAAARTRTDIVFS